MEDLKNRILSLTDDELKKIVFEDYKDYAVEALNIARKELNERDIGVELDQTIINANIQAQEKKLISDNSDLKGRYPALKNVVILLKIAAGILIAIFIFYTLVTLYAQIFPTSTLIAISVFFIILIVLVYAVAEIIEVVVDMESNSRATAELLIEIRDELRVLNRTNHINPNS